MSTRRLATLFILLEKLSEVNVCSLKRVKVVNQQNEGEKECQDRRSIEHEVSEHNKKHFRNAHSSNSFKDRTHSKLKSDYIRDKTLKGTLKREECDHHDVYEFLQ